MSETDVDIRTKEDMMDEPIPQPNQPTAEEGPTVQEQLAWVTEQYRRRTRQAYPHLPPKLIDGDTVDAIDRSVERAERAWAEAQAAAREQAARATVVGSAPRREPDLSRLSPREKILLGLPK
ncbi:MAG: hypothetical protein NZ518_09420 [Dehalococcoidia bacterium]|nr:hypothetical protein [Dehalococcoidia bacterium]